MCARAGIDAQLSDGTPKRADRLNADLAKTGTYNKTEAKEVTGWLGRRNDAAHGHHDRYSEAQVELLIESVRGFIVRHPA